MIAWVIVPKGTGDLAERVTLRGRNVGIALTLFVEPEVARKALARLPLSERDLAEVVQIEVVIR